MKRWWVAMVVILVAAGLCLARPGAAVAQDGETPTPAPTETATATATDTVTPTATPTVTPLPFAQATAIEPNGDAVLYENRWTAGERAIFDGEMALFALLGLRFIYDLVRQWMH